MLRGSIRGWVESNSQTNSRFSKQLKREFTFAIYRWNRFEMAIYDLNCFTPWTNNGKRQTANTLNSIEHIICIYKYIYEDIRISWRCATFRCGLNESHTTLNSNTHNVACGHWVRYLDPIQFEREKIIWCCALNDFANWYDVNTSTPKKHSYPSIGTQIPGNV